MFKIGHSTDIHRLVQGRDLILGGVKIDHPYGLDGHSDADVLLHAITESIIGALGLGDIGTLFPDTDDKYLGIDSMILLQEVNKIMHDKGFKIVNIDATLYLEEPKIRPYGEVIVNNIAAGLQIDSEQVNVKATRGEKLGFIGRKEGIAAEAVVLITND